MDWRFQIVEQFKLLHPVYISAFGIQRFSDIFYNTLSNMAKSKNWSEEYLKKDVDDLDPKGVAMPRSVPNPLLGQDLLAIHVANKFFLIDLHSKA